MPPIIFRHRTLKGNQQVQGTQSHPRHETHGNRSERRSFWVNTALLVCTLLAIWVSKQGTDIANESLEYARGKDSLDKVSQTAKDSLDSIKDKENRASIERSLAIAQQNADAASLQARTSEKNLNGQYRAIDLTVKQFEENKKQFSSVNRPFLVIDKPTATLIEGEPLKVVFSISNVGNIPAKTGYGMSHIYTASDNNAEILKEGKEKFTNSNENVFRINDYIVKGIPVVMALKNSAFDKAAIKKLEGGDSYIVVYLEQHYVNPYDNSRWSFRLIFKLWKWKNHALENVVEVLHNENEPL